MNVKKYDSTILINMSNEAYKNLQELCCCDTVPVKNCPPTCCIQLSCEQCSKTVRICKDGWKKTGETTLLCSRCM